MPHTPPHQPRRRDRATDDAAIRELLTTIPFCTIAHADGGQPFAHVNTFVYHAADHAIYLHTAATGRLRDTIRVNPRVCLVAGEMGRLLPAAEALHFSVEYRSAVVFGRMAVIDDPGQAAAALQCLLDRYFPHLRPDVDYRGITAGELKRTAVYRLAVENWSGKAKSVPADFPGAFTWKDIPHDA